MTGKVTTQPAITCSKLAIETLEQGVKWRRSGVLIVNFEHISHLVLMFILLTLSKYHISLCHCVKSVRTRSTFRSVFFRIHTEYKTYSGNLCDQSEFGNLCDQSESKDLL